MARVKIHVSEVKPRRIGDELVVMGNRVKEPKESHRPSTFLCRSTLWMLFPFTVMGKKGRDKKKIKYLFGQI